VAEATLLYFDRASGGFREACIEIRVESGKTVLEPSLIAVREFQQALRRYMLGRFDTPGVGPSSQAGDLPRPVVEGLLHRMEGALRQRSEDGGRGIAELHTTDRLAEQIRLQRAEGLPHRLAVLGRYHRRRGDFLGGHLDDEARLGFGFTTGGSAGDFHKEPNEDALGVDHVGDVDVYVVADAHHGSRSSELAVLKVLDLCRLAFTDYEPEDEQRIPDFLANAIVRCHDTILGDVRAERSMTNLVAAIRTPSALHWASVSDAFLLKVHGAGIARINRDLGHGIVRRRQGIWLGDRHFHKRFIDRGTLRLTDDWVLLATDGLFKHTRYPPERLLHPLRSGTAPRDFAAELTENLARAGRDNAAFVLLRGGGEIP
jgi:serine/threonine protein phosphatase PrpC